ncbi:MAG: 4-aminobutyraldehyde dehydrogenase [Conexibacter sp.]|nr:4-aminobutyraldehyde dehydrogenase [Conexibacter sp.]
MPHGGVGQSGYGKDLSVYALEEHTRVKHVIAKLH